MRSFPARAVTIVLWAPETAVSHRKKEHDKCGMRETKHKNCFGAALTWSMVSGYHETHLNKFPSVSG